MTGLLRSEAEQIRHYADVRARLMGLPRRIVRPRLAVAQPALLPEPSVEAPPKPRGAPLNMLAPCSWKFLRELAALRHGVGSRDIMSHSRARAIVAARYEAMALVYQHTQASLPQVGRLFGRDHTTVFHALRKMSRHGKLVDILPMSLGKHRKRVLVPPGTFHRQPVLPFTVAVEGSVHG